MRGRTRLGSEMLHDAWPFLRLRRDRIQAPRTDVPHDFYIVEAGPWINIVPLTMSQDVVMVRQFRHGIERLTLEVPGGLVDPGEDPAIAAARELREETGYSGRLEQIGRIHPNPALQTNTLYTFVARDVVRVTEQDLESSEDIDVVLVPLEEIPARVRRGEIDHALVLVAFVHLMGLGASR